MVKTKEAATDSPKMRASTAGKKAGSGENQTTETSDKPASDRDVQDVIGGVTKRQFHETESRMSKLENDKAKITGDISAALNKFEENGGNKLAFKDAKALMAMDPQNARDRIRSREAYLKEMGFYNEIDMFEKQNGTVDSTIDLVKRSPLGGITAETSIKPAAEPKSLGAQQADAFMATAPH